MTAIDTIKISKEDELLAYLVGLPEVAEIRTVIDKEKESDWIQEENTALLKTGFELTEQTHNKLFGIFRQLFDKFGISPNLRLFKENKPGTVGAENAGIWADGNQITVIFSNNILNLIDDPLELTSIIGHELGHFLFEFADPNRLDRRLIQIRQIKPDELLPAEKRFLKSKRAADIFDLCSMISQIAELSADRIGLYACRDFEASIISSMKLTAGPVDKFGIYEPRTYLTQAENLMKTQNYFTAQDVDRGHPWEPLRVKALEYFYYSDVYRQLIGASGARYKLDEFDEILPEIIPLKLIKMSGLKKAKAATKPDLAKTIEKPIIARIPAPESGPVQIAVTQAESSPAQPAGDDPTYERDLYLNYALAEVFGTDGKFCKKEDVFRPTIFRHRADLDKMLDSIINLSDAQYDQEYDRLRKAAKGFSAYDKRYIMAALLNAARADGKVAKKERDLMGIIADEIGAVDIWQQMEDNAFGSATAKIEKVQKLGIAGDEAYIYYVNKRGTAVMRAKAIFGPRGGIKGYEGEEIVVACEVKREPGYLYFIDKDGDVSRAPLK